MTDFFITLLFFFLHLMDTGSRKATRVKPQKEMDSKKCFAINSLGPIDFFLNIISQKIDELNFGIEFVSQWIFVQIQ